tara:strand:+ start:272 stop:544 length:273 start_codon:yes stop_codon:yes gene_type:complete
MVQSRDNGNVASIENIGKDVFLKSFQRQAGNISQSQLDSLVAEIQNLNLSVLTVGSFTPDTQNTVKLIVEGADNLANGDIAGHVIGDVTF